MFLRPFVVWIQSKTARMGDPCKIEHKRRWPRQTLENAGKPHKGRWGGGACRGQGTQGTRSAPDPFPTGIAPFCQGTRGPPKWRIGHSKLAQILKPNSGENIIENWCAEIPNIIKSGVKIIHKITHDLIMLPIMFSDNVWTYF